MLMGGPPEARQIENPQYGLRATVILVPAVENHGFFAVDVPKRTRQDDIRRHWETGYAFLLNGGYFNTEDFTPVGLTRIEGVEINRNVAPRLSGFVAITEGGSLQILTKADDVAGFTTVVQCGPFLVDPGGILGLKSRDGRVARRTVVGVMKDQTLVFAVAEPITLFDLARAMMAEFPSLDRLLNLDGGPSTALKARHIEVLNEWPVRNYIGKRSSGSRFRSARHLAWTLPAIIALIFICRRKCRTAAWASTGKEKPRAG